MPNQDLLALQLQFRQQRQPYALATVVEIFGSSSAKPTAKAIFNDQGDLLAGWIGGGCAQSMVASAALVCLSEGSSQMVEIDLTDEVFGAGMPCGGHMRVYVEAVLPKPQLWLIGHGRIVETICEFASRVGFAVIVNDAQANPKQFPTAEQLINDDCRYQQLTPQTGDFVLIATHHKGDYEALIQALGSDAGYIALIASQKRSQLVLNRLTQTGFNPADLNRIHAPAGLDLAAKTPEEIALAIVSEMVLLRRGGSGLALSKSTPNFR